MTYIEDALLLTSIEEIDKEIKERIELRSNMVGQLYPAIVTDEIYRLNMRRRKIEDEDR